MKKVLLAMLAVGVLTACMDKKQTTDKDMKQELTLTQEWDKVFPLSEKVNHKKETGMTAQRYIQNKVIDLSKQYVLDKELTLNQVAYKLGFQYPQHFTRLFKKEVGVTPSEYRN
jgi:YesN/AraC family two-component response regulator